MKIPFGTISITEKSQELILEALESKRLSCGKYVREFEKRFAELTGTKEAIATSSGTDAIAMALAVLYDKGAKRGDEVILPALSFVATGNAVLQAGFTPIFVDIDRATLNIDPSRIEEVLTEKTCAIVPVHLMGKPADMDTINEIGKRHQVCVIEDAAEAHGGIYKGRNVGGLGDMAAFSLYVAHIVSTVEGGIITTNNPEYAEIMRSLRSHGRACKCESCVLNTSSAYCAKRFNNSDNTDIRFLFERVGFSTKMNELEAAVGLGNLELFDEILTKRRENLRYLREGLRDLSPLVGTIEEEPYEETGPHAFPIIVQEQAGFTREQIADYMEKRGIDVRNLFSSIPTQCQGFSFMGHHPGDFPHAEFIGRQAIHIGVHQDMGQAECDYVLTTVKEFLSENS